MKFTQLRGALCLLLLGATAPFAAAQDLVGQLKNDVRNTFSQQPAAAYPPAASTANTTDRPTGTQFRSTSAIGGWVGHRIATPGGTLLAGPETATEGATTVKLPADANGLKLQNVRFGRGLNVRTPDAYFGDILPPPNVDDQGIAVDGLTAFYAQPHNTGDFYYSAASNQVFASQAGVVFVEWRLKTANPAEVRIVPVSYVVAASTNPAKEAARRIYWTRNGYKGPLVIIPDSVRLNLVYNREVPEVVTQEFTSPYEVQTNRAPAQIVTQTLWLQASTLNCYNREGLVFMELLDRDNRFLATQVVQIIREAPPVIVKSDIGSRVYSFPKDDKLTPRVITGLLGTSFVDLVGKPSLNELHIYARRTTSPVPDDAFGNPRSSGELTVFWMQKSKGEIEWPMIFNSYIIGWPAINTPGAYTTFLRQDSGDSDSQATAVRLTPGNNSSLLFQDDPLGTQTYVDNGNELHTRLDNADRDGLSLVRHQIGEEVWYERVYSILAADQPQYSSVNVAEVGKRILPPSGAGLDGVVGYVRLHPTDLNKRKYRSAFDPSAYINPFSEGFEEAKAGAIIPVNARSVPHTTGIYQDELEVWWYKASTPPAGSINLKPNYYPALAMVYQLSWPSDAEKIVLASNKGSGPLASPQASGRIYYENDDTKPGFNPNDEHALLIGDTAWALRDDLGTRATSSPCVLLRYSDATDSRPSMRVFSIMREDLSAVPPIKFSYTVEAGKRLNAPMPLPVLSPVFNNGAPANYEDVPVKVPFVSNGSAPGHYNKFTFIDRKGGMWLYRGPHTEQEAGQSFDMKYFYPSQTGFYIPGKNLNEQPVAGKAMPYLRRLPVAATAEELETFAKAADNQDFNKQSIGITYTPTWPKFAPVMRMGETLTTPRYGLPAIRGQTSASVIYEQASSNDSLNEKSSVTLIDPTVAKKSELPDDLVRLPDSVVTNAFQGKVYFPNLPPHLAERIYFDPNQGSRGALIFKGTFVDEVLGADYLLLNVLTAKDVKDVKALCIDEDNDKADWDSLVDDLAVDAVRHVANTAKPGTYAPEQPDKVIAVTQVWNYLKSVQWRNQKSPLTQSQIAKGSGVSASKNALDLATAWVRENFDSLVAADRIRNDSAGADEEQKTLRDRCINHLGYSAPNSARVANQVLSGTTYHYRSAAASADQWAAFETRRNAVSVIADWITAKSAGQSSRAWATTGAGLTLADVQALRAKTWSVSLRITSAKQEYFNLTESSTLTAVPSDLAVRAWNFVTEYSAQLAQWSRNLSSPTGVAGAFSLLEADYRRAEMNGRVNVDATTLVEAVHDDVAVDSYALSADGGEGWVTLIVGNGRAFTPVAEPVSMYIVRVERPLASGEIKVVQSSNPLAEKLTMQSSNDFAGKPEQYEFQWKTLPPVDGLPPAVYSFSRNLAMGDGTWKPTYENGDATDPTSLNLPANVSLAGTLNDDGSVDDKPLTALTRTFNLPALPYRAFLSFTLGAADGVSVSVNGNVVALRNYPDSVDTATVSPPLSSFAPLTHLIEIPGSALEVGANEVSLELVTTAPAGTTSLVNCRLETMLNTDLTGTWNTVSPSADESAAGEVTTTPAVLGKNRLTIEGQSLFTLTDNYFIYRYRAIDDSHDAYEDLPGGGWSNWTEPQLGEGWIKRALAGINPFEQRLKDLYNNAVNTDVSLVTQAGKRWEGDVALNLANINDYGLIEIYETILRRGKSLSIEGAPGITYGPANDALLLAAGYLNDLYSILGNEAYADAQNSTIAYGTNSGQLGDTASAQFAFKGQLASVLDEELTLLRGRDDFFAPGTRVTPVFNRLIWNYTRGIASGEVVYALNYNIKDLNADGGVNAADAAKAYPQGHGDAYGHYLMALKNYYSLLWNPYFNWIPRIEAVLVLGKPVSVDYLDERKFAGTAAAWTRTAAQTLDLTYRQSYDPAAKGVSSFEGDSGTDIPPTWSHLGNVRSNSRTAVTRTWGVDDWAVRGGQGSFFHWLSASAMLPESDPDPTHEGIQKIDRTTVVEIGEIAVQAEAIQRLLDNADQHLNPLGLSDGAVPFDVAVNVATDEVGQPHYEQIYERALGALTNAGAAFDRAKGATALLRDQDETLDEQRDAIYSQERAFENQLIDLYGTPYADDIGPGKTYPQDYSGPDLLHYAYVEMPELYKNVTEDDAEEQEFILPTNLNFGAALDNASKWSSLSWSSGLPTDFTIGLISGLADRTDRVMLIADDGRTIPDGAGAQKVSFNLTSNGVFKKPEDWVGRRRQPGAIQAAVSTAMMSRLELSNVLEDHQDFAKELGSALRLYRTAYTAHYWERTRSVIDLTVSTILEGKLSALEAATEVFEEAEVVKQEVLDATIAALANKIAGAGANTVPVVDPLLPVIPSAGATKLASKSALFAAVRLQILFNGFFAATQELGAGDIAWRSEHLQLITDLKARFEELEDVGRSVDQAIRAHSDAQDNIRTLVAQGDAIQRERSFVRRRSSGIIQGYRTKDLGFRTFRDEALESYRSLFDLASRYTYLASRAYDYETALLDPVRSTKAKGFLQDIVKARAVGVITDGVPQQVSSTTGDPGLSGVLARLNADWSVAKHRLGINNPARNQTVFSLRREMKRMDTGEDGDVPWKDYLATCRRANLLADEDVKRHCLNINPRNLLTVPGYVIEFSTTIEEGVNFFGNPLMGGDQTFSPSAFTTKIRASGIGFKGYIGMASPTAIGGSVESPNDPGTGFSDPNALSATPYVYFVPSGMDSMRAPSNTDTNIIRSWMVEDQAIPLPFDIGGAFSSANALSGFSTLREQFTLRKHGAFRAVPGDTVFSSATNFTSTRLISRSVWNSKWKLVIPGSTLLAEPINGMAKFLQQVKDIQIYFDSYSAAGN